MVKRKATILREYCQAATVMMMTSKNSTSPSLNWSRDKPIWCQKEQSFSASTGTMKTLLWYMDARIRRTFNALTSSLPHAIMHRQMPTKLIQLATTTKKSSRLTSKGQICRLSTTRRAFRLTILEMTRFYLNHFLRQLSESRQDNTKWLLSSKSLRMKPNSSNMASKKWMNTWVWSLAKKKKQKSKMT